MSPQYNSSRKGLVYLLQVRQMSNNTKINNNNIFALEGVSFVVTTVFIKVM